MKLIFLQFERPPLPTSQFKSSRPAKRRTNEDSSVCSIDSSRSRPKRTRQSREREIGVFQDYTSVMRDTLEFAKQQQREAAASSTGTSAPSAALGAPPASTGPSSVGGPSAALGAPPPAMPPPAFVPPPPPIPPPTGPVVGPSGDNVAAPTEVISNDIFTHWAHAMLCRLRAANSYRAQQAMLEMDAIALRLFK